MITIFISLLQIAAEYHLMHTLRLDIQFGNSFEIQFSSGVKIARGWSVFRTHSDTLGIMCFIAMLYVSCRI